MHHRYNWTGCYAVAGTADVYVAAFDRTAKVIVLCGYGGQAPAAINRSLRAMHRMHSVSTLATA